MDCAVKFVGGRHPLSNFYPVKIHLWRHVFPNVESAYEFKKAIFHGDKSTAENIKATRPGHEAKSVDKNIKQTRPCSE